MYCKYCGKEIVDGASFCQHCGGQQKESTTVVSSNLLESHDISIEDKFRKVLKFVFKKLFHFICIVLIAFVAAFVMYHTFMQINKPYKNKEEAHELYQKRLAQEEKQQELLKEFSSSTQYENYFFTAPRDYGTYKYDQELTGMGAIEQMELSRWFVCENHAKKWSKWIFIIVCVGLLGFYFLKWLYQPKGKNSNDI